jgi:ribosomal protein L12E/L44/L45/RPP1/RPP2
LNRAIAYRDSDHYISATANVAAAAAAAAEEEEEEEEEEEDSET